MSHFAALGLARAYEVTGAFEYAAVVWDWLDWYYAHMDANGFVTDYDVVNGALVSTNDMDSTDSYAALFLMVYDQIWKVTEDTGRMNALEPAVAKAIDAIEQTYDTQTKLTGAKPAYMAKFLMDNSEVYGGLKAGLRLAVYFGDTDLQARIVTLKNNISTGLEGIWNSGNQNYDRAVAGDGTHEASDWDYLYPDALSQAWTIAFDVTNSSRAQSLMTTFNTEHPYWDQPEQYDLFRGMGSQQIEYWPTVGWAYAKIGNYTRALEAAWNIRQGALGVNRAWPFNCLRQGELLILETGCGI